MSELIYKAQILREPRDDEYRALIETVAPMAARALLVLGPSPASARARAIVGQLALALRVSEWRNEWPGTRTTVSRKVNEYELSKEIIEVLATAVDGLYEWVTPNAPEDLAFLRPDGSPILYVTAHEEEAFIVVDARERDQIVSASLPIVRWYDTPAP
jgi:hypothetical protein